MTTRTILIPLLWAVFVGGFGYFATLHVDNGPREFPVVGQEPHADYRHQFIGVACLALGLACGIVLLFLRNRSIGALVGLLTGAGAAFASYWDLQTLPDVLFWASFMALIGGAAGFASVRQRGFK